MITILMFLLATAAARSPQAGGGPPPRANGDGLVELALVADRDAIRPGESFRLGVHLRIEPRWHVYWENPGDSGIPTTATISAPAGFEVDRLRYPAPERHELEGDIISYIHHGDLLLVADVVAPNDLAAGSQARFAVESRWLVCTDVCFAGSKKAELALPVVAQGVETKPANAKLFAAAQARMPRPWSEIAASANVTRAGDEPNPAYKVRVRGASALEFFPCASETTALAARSVKIGDAGGTIELLWRFEAPEPGERPQARGLLQVRTAQGEAFYSFDPSALDAESDKKR